MKSAWIESLLVAIWLVLGACWVHFMTVSAVWWLSVSTVLAGYYAYHFIGIPLLSKPSYYGSVSLKSMAVGTGVVNILLMVALLAKSMQWPKRNELIISTFVCIVVLVLAEILLHLWSGVSWSKPIKWRCCVLAVILVVWMQVSDGDWMTWRYRNYPAFVQTYQCLELDPENPVLLHELQLEHMRIVLSPDEFESFETQHKLYIRGKNNW